MMKYLVICFMLFSVFIISKSQCDEKSLVYGCVFPIPSNNFISGDGTSKVLFSEHIIFNIITGASFVIGSLTVMIGLVFGIWGIGFFWITISITNLFVTRSFSFFTFFPVLIGLILSFTLWLMVKPFRKEIIMIKNKTIKINTKTACRCGKFGDFFMLDGIDGKLFIYVILVGLIYIISATLSTNQEDQKYWFLLETGLFFILGGITAAILSRQNDTWIARYVFIIASIILPFIHLTIGLSSSLQIVFTNNITVIENNVTTTLLVNDSGTNVAIIALIIVLIGGIILELIAVEIAMMMRRDTDGIISRASRVFNRNNKRDNDDENIALIDDDDTGIRVRRDA